MARKTRVEIEGGLYHVITRGNDRQNIFHSDADHRKFLSLLAAQKERLPFFLYAYCMMSNHIHLLIECRTDNIGRIMHRVLTGYSQYYNWRYNKVGRVLQGRHKPILCQSEVYMGQLVRYIHLNPVRAKMVSMAEDYPYSSQRTYLGLEPEGIVDVDPVLRLFGPKRKLPASVSPSTCLLVSTSAIARSSIDKEGMGSEGMGSGLQYCNLIRISSLDGLGTCLFAGGATSTLKELVTFNLDHLPFGSSLTASLACFH